jgi:hypothetical protein
MGEETLIAAIIATLALIIAGIALTIAVKTSDETQKLAGELHRTPADINVYETRVTPAIAYSSVEGGKAPEWMAAATKRQLNSMRYTRRG